MDKWVDELLTLHNKLQEAIQINRPGAVFYADPKFVSIGQKILNLGARIKTQREKINESDKNK